MSSPLHFLDWFIILFYFAAVILIGLFRSGKFRSSTTKFILAGRKLSLPGFIATLVTTWYGGILGIGENTYNNGIQTWFIFGLPYYVFAIAFALFMASKIQKAKQISIPDHFYSKYGKAAGIISAIYLLFLASPAPYILSIGILLKFATGMPLAVSIIASAIFSLVYIWFGGFRSVVRTDILQFILMFGSFIILIFFAWSKIGSPLSIISSLPESHISPLGDHSLQYVIVWFFIALWTFVDPGFYQRCAAAKSPEVARRGILISVILWFIFDSLTLISGLYARVYLPNSPALFALPQLGANILPTIFYGLFLTGLIATIMSTIDSLGLISAVTFGRDIIWRIKNHTMSGMRDNSVRYVQFGLVLTSAIAISLALMVPSVVNLWYLTGSIIVPGLLIPFLLTFTEIRLRKSAGLYLIILPVMVTLIWFTYGKIVDNYPLHIEPFYPGIATSIFMLIIFYYKEKLLPQNNLK